MIHQPQQSAGVALRDLQPVIVTVIECGILERVEYQGQGGAKLVTDVLEELIKEEHKFAAHDEVGAAVERWRSKAWDNTIKWDSVWGAKIADNDYILAGWAAE